MHGVAQTTTPPSLPWVRHLTTNHGVIVFVHGVMGDERSTWTSSDQYWPVMLTRDTTFDGQNIYVYHYPSPKLSRGFSVDEVAENMRLVLTTDGVLRHSELTFVSHSMGGLVTRAFILKYQRIASKIRLLYFFATPTTGSPYAILANVVSRNPQFKQLYPMQSDNYLGPLQSNWLAANLRLRSYCGYETLPLFGQIIVERQSATNLCTERLDPIDADHVTIVKPVDEKSTPYRALKSAFDETAPPDRLANHVSSGVKSPGSAPGPKGASQSVSNSAATNVTAQPGSVVSIGQQGGITAGVIGMIINSLPANPGFGLLSRKEVTYDGPPLAFLERQPIVPADKAPGTYYVAVFLSRKTQYQKTQNADRIAATLKTLNAMSGVKVFYSPSPGGYTLVKDGAEITSGGNISTVGENTDVWVCYFDSALEDVADRIKKAVDAKEIRLRTPTNKSSNPDVLLQYDLWKASGVDIEVIL
jgi:pimeloyl-ACP methyl ester carboxylesterase